jgi:hypothetical protein
MLIAKLLKNIPYTNSGGELSVVGLQRYIPILGIHSRNPG